MNARKIVSVACAVITAAILSALLAAPSTGWIARMQVAQLTAPTGDIWGLRRTLAPPPESQDYRIALASAASSYDQRMTRLYDLTSRFPDTPSVYANVLRYATQSSFHLHRDESYLIEGQSPSAINASQSAAASPDSLNAFDHAAIKGEESDPRNAYFPAMRSIGLFAQHRDDEALAAMYRAAQKPEWREYYADEVQGDMRWRENACGQQSAVARTAIMEAILFPHYASLRSAARVAADLAMQSEMRGETARGAQIRLDLIKIGALMRTQGQSGITTLVGIGISRTALLRPGGAAAPKNSGDDLSTEQLDAFCDYLQSTHSGVLIPAIRAEFASETAAKNVIEGVVNSKKSPFDAWLPLGTQWLMGWIILVNVLWVLLCGAGAALLTRSGVFAGTPSRARTAAVRAGVLTAAAVLFPQTPESWFEHYRAILQFAGDAAALLAIAAMVITSRNLGRAATLVVRDAAVTSLIAYGVGAIVIAQTKVLLYSGDALSSLSNLSSGGVPVLMFHFPWNAIALIESPLTPLALTTATAIVCIIIARIRRRPVRPMLLQGFRSAALPIAVAGVCLYAGCLVTTAQMERIQNKSLDRIMENEGAYFAEVSHQDWPGMTQWPKSES